VGDKQIGKQSVSSSLSRPTHYESQAGRPPMALSAVAVFADVSLSPCVTVP
jgi:hypothetical protein